MLTRATDADVPAIVELMNVAFRATGPGASWNSPRNGRPARVLRSSVSGWSMRAIR